MEELEKTINQRSDGEKEVNARIERFNRYSHQVSQHYREVIEESKKAVEKAQVLLARLRKTKGEQDLKIEKI
jgi:hypothetical protein